MIWLDNVNRGTGGATKIGSATIYRQVFNVLKYGDGEIIFSLNHNEQSGTVHFLSTLNWLINHGYESTGTTIGQIDFGWEICSTGGLPETFTVSHYSISSPCLKSGCMY
jgi:hypothetical protein